MSDKLTPWFPSDVKPVYVGEYEVESFSRASVAFRAEWNGRQWIGVTFGKPLGFQVRRWRGLSKRPTKHRRRAMTVADEIRIRDDNEVEVTSAMAGTSLHRFSYWREARRFAWGVAHENQLAVNGEDRDGFAVCWSRPMEQSK